MVRMFEAFRDDEKAAVAKLQASIDTCIADAHNHAAKREEMAEARWKAIMAMQDIKLALLKTISTAKIALAQSQKGGGEWLEMP